MDSEIVMNRKLRETIGFTLIALFTIALLVSTIIQVFLNFETQNHFAFWGLGISFVLCLGASIVAIWQRKMWLFAFVIGMITVIRWMTSTGKVVELLILIILFVYVYWVWEMQRGQMGNNDH